MPINMEDFFERRLKDLQRKQEEAAKVEGRLFPLPYGSYVHVICGRGRPVRLAQFMGLKGVSSVWVRYEGSMQETLVAIARVTELRVPNLKKERKAPLNQLPLWEELEERRQDS